MWQTGATSLLSVRLFSVIVVIVLYFTRSHVMTAIPISSCRKHVVSSDPSTGDSDAPGQTSGEADLKAVGIPEVLPVLFEGALGSIKKWEIKTISH